MTRFPTFSEYLADRVKKGEQQVVATDALVRYKQDGRDGLIVIERKNPPHGFAPPGGMGERMMLQRNIVKEVAEETGLAFYPDVSSFYRPIVLYKPGQDFRAEIASSAYTGIGHGTLSAQSDAKNVLFCTLEEIAEMLLLPVSTPHSPSSTKTWACPHHKILYALALETGAHRYAPHLTKNIVCILNDYHQEIERNINEELDRQQKIRAGTLKEAET